MSTLFDLVTPQDLFNQGVVWGVGATILLLLNIYLSNRNSSFGLLDEACTITIAISIAAFGAYFLSMWITVLQLICIAQTMQCISREVMKWSLMRMRKVGATIPVVGRLRKVINGLAITVVVVSIAIEVLQYSQFNWLVLTGLTIVVGSIDGILRAKNLDVRIEEIK